MSIKKVWHKLKSVPIIGNTYEKYIGIRKVAYIEKKCNQELFNEGERYINLVESALSDSGMLYYVYAGTLLGLIRDGKFISWDLDIDYAILIENDFSWNKLEKIMKKNGFKKTREYVFEGQIKEQSYAIGKMNIDFFGQFYEENYMLQYSFEYRTDCVYKEENERSVYLVTLPKVIETQKLKLGSVLVSVPKNSEEILTALYNDDWHIPNPNWVPNSGKCSKLLENKIAYKIVL